MGVAIFVIVSTGVVSSIIFTLKDEIFNVSLTFPAASVTLIVTSSYKPRSNVSNVIVLFPTIALVVVVNGIEHVIVPTSSEEKT